MKRIDRTNGGEERGEMGIGTLIIFIAMVLVAAVAASVLINTAGILQQQAEKTGTQAINEVSNSIIVRDVVGDRYNYADPSNLSNKVNILEVSVGLAAGSPPIDMSNVMIEVTGNDAQASLLFDREGQTSYVAGDAGDATATKYSVVCLRDPQGTFDGTGTSDVANVMSYGTVVKIYINLSAIGIDLGPMDSLTLKIMPHHGNPTIESIEMPETLADGRYIDLL